MKILNSTEIQNVSGGVDGVTALWALSFVNLAIGLYNASQISKQNEILETIFVLTLYQEAQLMQLPRYDEVTALSLAQVGQIVFN